MLYPFLQTLASVAATLIWVGFAEDLQPQPSPWRLLACGGLALSPLGLGRLWRLCWGHPSARRRSALALRSLVVSPFVVQMVSIGALSWAAVLAGLGLHRLALLREILLLAPYLLAAACVDIAVEREWAWRLGRAARSWRAALARLRRECLVLVPLLVFVGADSLLRVEGIAGYVGHIPALSWLLVLALLAALALLFPFLLRWSLAWGPLPAGSPVRAAVKATLEELRFSCRDVLLWRTGGLVANAAIVGLTARLRYIVLTDVLVARLQPQELRVVLAHEIGHGKNHHAKLFLAFLAACLLLLREVDGWVSERLIPLDGPAGLGSELAVIGIWLVGFLAGFGVVFGLLSRRFELEADLCAVEAGGGAESFVRALERVSELARVRRTKRSWRHFSPGERATFVTSAFAPAGDAFRRRFRQRQRRLRLAIALVFGVALVLFARSMAAATLVGLGALALEQGRAADAACLVEKGLRLGGSHAAALRLLLRAHREREGPSALLEDLERFLPPEGFSGPAGRDFACYLETLASDVARDGHELESERILAHARRLRSLF
ncbi:MAG: M48 family metalloprotease [Planctomycetota bacterium]